MIALFQKAATPLVILAVMTGFAALLGLLALRTVEVMISDARASAISERDAHWQAEISKSEAAVQKQIAENLKNTLATDQAARAHVAAVEAQFFQLESDNAALPTTDACGLGRARVRLLNKQ